jgi:thiol-disulfide isomerase/thioredoxin
VTARTTDQKPGLIRSWAHRLGGDSLDLPVLGQVASFDAATAWINSEPLTAQQLRGRVVLVDFWTYTCVNWLRTLPYVRAWDAKYGEAGLTIVGVHTPEFQFEHDIDNVRWSTTEFGVRYPVAQDNDYGVWRAFSNHFWPALYLADTEGRIRFQHFGEGEYAMTEMAIQQLLMDAGADVDQELVTVEPRGLEVSADWRVVQSPESYVGYGQSNGFAGAQRDAFDTPFTYTMPQLRLNEWGLSGNWTVSRPAAGLNEAGGRIGFRFHARDVNLVMGPQASGSAIRFRVYLDGEPAREAPGSDLTADATGTVREQRTYQLVRQATEITDRVCEIEFLDSGVEAYCFTFG